MNQKSPDEAPLNPWEWPKRLWSRIHIDHLGPIEGDMTLVVVDAHSKWNELKRYLFPQPHQYRQELF